MASAVPVPLSWAATISVLGRRLPADDYQVTVGDRSPNHRVALDLEHEQRSVADQSPGQAKGLFGQLRSVQGDSGPDLPDERHLDLLAPGPRPGSAEGWTICVAVRLRDAGAVLLQD